MTEPLSSSQPLVTVIVKISRPAPQPARLSWTLRMRSSHHRATRTGLLVHRPHSVVRGAKVLSLLTDMLASRATNHFVFFIAE